jgi:Ion channel
MVDKEAEHSENESAALTTTGSTDTDDILDSLHRGVIRASSSRRDVTGGFGELNEALRLHRKIGVSLKDGKYETLDRLYTGSAPVTWMEERMMQFQARERSIRQCTAAICSFFAAWLVAGVFILVYVGGLSFQDALLYSMYSITSTGFGTVKIPQTRGFLAFAIIFMFVGIAFVALTVRWGTGSWQRTISKM